MSLAKELLDVVLNTFNNLHIVIDGVDDCTRMEKERISSTFISVAESRISCIRCCFISQDDKDTGKLFRGLPTLQITEQHDQRDILEYCRGMEDQIAKSFQFSAPDIQNLNIQHVVATKAQGEEARLPITISKY